MAFKINDRICLFDLVGTVLSEPVAADYMTTLSGRRVRIADKILVLFDGASEPVWTDPSVYIIAE
jgi:hypothetical protein